MKVLVISDSHGNIANLKHTLGFAKKINVEAIIHCGDWNNVSAAETVIESGIPAYPVLGNADIDPEIESTLTQKSKKFTRTLLEFELDGRKIGVIHNLRHLDSSNEVFDILFYGHTHRQKESTINGIKVVNPGALENDIYFAIYDTETNKVELTTT